MNLYSTVGDCKIRRTHTSMAMPVSVTVGHGKFNKIKIEYRFHGNDKIIKKVGLKPGKFFILFCPRPEFATAQWQ
jgi:predicted glycosyltransferase